MSWDEIKFENARLRVRVAQLESLINTPATADFLRAVELEAAHQIERWGEDSRAVLTSSKDDSDWLWLVAYLSVKAVFGKKRLVADWMARDVRSSAVEFARLGQPNPDGGSEKKAHRIISIAAAALNWHRNTWPGAAPAKGVIDEPPTA